MPNSNRARALRRKYNWAQKLLWRWLRDRRFNGYKFRREHPVGTYSLDFFCAEAHLCIELDGLGHGHPRRQARDAQRTKFLETRGIRELRFWNSQLRKDGESIRDTIYQALQERAPHPLPDYTRTMAENEKRSGGTASPDPKVK